MLYSVFYRIQNRYRFFEKFCRKFVRSDDEAVAESMRETYEDLMEIIVKLLLDENKNDMFLLLSKKNSRNARIFFDYFTGYKTKSAKTDELLNIIDNFFKKEEQMKNITSFIAEKVKPVNFKIQYVPFKLNEADDDGGDDPFADTPDADVGGDDMGGDDMGGSDAGGDPFATDAGDDAGGSGEGGGEGAAEGDEESDENDEYDFAGHEDDPDFNAESSETGDLGQPMPAAKCVCDAKAALKALNAIVQTLPSEELAEIDAVKKAVTLIFNGKVLKPEDVTFQNPKNAAYLLKKIGENVDEKTRSYMMLKIKQPLIKLRDAKKAELANIETNTNNIRNTILSLDK